jgi:hypothetical protein
LRNFLFKGEPGGLTNGLRPPWSTFYILSLWFNDESRLGAVHESPSRCSKHWLGLLMSRFERMTPLLGVKPPADREIIGGNHEYRPAIFPYPVYRPALRSGLGSAQMASFVNGAGFNTSDFPFYFPKLKHFTMDSDSGSVLSSAPSNLELTVVVDPLEPKIITGETRQPNQEYPETEQVCSSILGNTG